MRMVVIAILLGLVVILSMTTQKEQIKQQQAQMNEAERIYKEQMVRNCEQTLNASFCKEPKGKYDQYTCSDRLSSFGCAQLYDVSDMILDEHRDRTPPPKWWAKSSSNPAIQEKK